MNSISESPVVVKSKGQTLSVSFERTYDENDNVAVQVDIDEMVGYSGVKHLINIPLADAVEIAKAILAAEQALEDAWDMSIEDDYDSIRYPGAIWS